MTPLVTVMIATRNRPVELEDSLQQLCKISYEPVELLVVDDASDIPIEALIRRYFPAARYVRKESNAGQCKRRSEAFDLASGKYILQLDDDAAPVQSGGLQRAVDFLEKNPRIGLLSFYIFNGPELPEEPLHPADAKYATSFVGCAALIRKSAVAETGGYVESYGNEWEEEELSLRLLKAGWALYFFASVVIHHKVTPTNRRTDRTWMRGLRNKLWAHVMHFPTRRLPLEMGWTLAVGCLDAIRLFRVHRFLQALGLFAVGLPRALRLREPMSDLALRRYDALRFRGVYTAEEFADPPAIGWADIRGWLKRWRNRPRQRSVWDRRPGDRGECETVKFVHEYQRDRQSK